MRTIRMSEDVWQEIAKSGKFGKTEDDALRRIFNLPNNPNDNSKLNKLVKPTSPGRRRSFAKQTMTSYINDNKIYIEFQNGDSSSWLLPERENKMGIRKLVDDVLKFCESNGATVGQKNAARKTLTTENYHLTK